MCASSPTKKQPVSIFVEVTAIETLSGNSDITVCQVMQFRTLSVLSTSNGSRVNDPGISPGSANQCILGDMYLRSNLPRKWIKSKNGSLSERLCVCVCVCVWPLFVIRFASLTLGRTA